MTERYMVTAVPIDGGERVTGYYVCSESGEILIALHSKLPWDCFEFTSVDPDTIEPVMVKVKRDRTLVGDYRCPNCNAAFVGVARLFDDTPLRNTTPFCGACGQALDWSEQHNTAEPNRANGESE